MSREDRNRARVKAPAKLNLFLHVIGRRDDGYHELQTVFQLLDFGDEISLNRRDDGRIVRTGNDDVPEERDHVVRAATALKRACGARLGVDISVDKRVPLGGGLGGGSSDAAAVLRSLPALWEHAVDGGTLTRIALELGADVPVFLGAASAFGQGVGEKLTPVRLGRSWYVVLCPDVHVATAEIFAAPALTRNTKPLKITDFLRGGQPSGALDVERLLAATQNDCEAVVRANYPPVDKALRWLSRFGNARMTGTGACVFGRFDDEGAAEQVRAQAPAEWRAFVARGVDTVV